MFLLDWINLDEDFPPLVVLIGLLIFIGGQMTRPTPETSRITRRVGYLTWVLYAVTAAYSWGVSGPTDFVGVVLRASLATGLVYGATLIAMPAIDAVSALMKAKPMPISQPWTPPPPPTVEQKVVPKPEKSDHERKSQVDEARNEVMAFYDKHAEIHEAYPLELLRSQLAARFVDELKVDQAWAAAQNLIADMLSKVAEVRSEQRVEQEKARTDEERAKEQQRKDNEPEEKRHAVHKLTDWYQAEKEAIEQRLPVGPDREDILRELFIRYDRLMKEALQEIRP